MFQNVTRTLAVSLAIFSSTAAAPLQLPPMGERPKICMTTLLCAFCEKKNLCNPRNLRLIKMGGYADPPLLKRNSHTVWEG